MKVAKRQLVSKAHGGLQSSFGTTVRISRQQLGISQEELAWRSSLHRTYVADVERGSRNVSLRNIANLAEALEISIGDLLNRASGGLALNAAEGKARKPGEIILVEDSASDAELAVRALRRAGLMNPVVIIGDGETVLERLLGNGKRRTRRVGTLPLLVLLDIGLPKVSGGEVLRRLKGDERTRMIPVVMLTGSKSDQVITECARLGAVGYIIKPVGFDDLSRVSAKLNLRWSFHSKKTPAVAGLGAR
jgi:two-component system response regulator